MTAASIAGSGPASPDRIGVGEPAGAVTVVDLDGLADADVDFGDTEDELTRRGILRTDVDACGPTLAGHEAVSPIFVEDRLVLLWVGDPVRTPEGVAAGTPLTEVRERYPEARHLDAPQGTYRFDGLLARDGDRAYLFLHDGQTVRKVIAGYADWAQRAFDEGHSPC
ncbi:hypothetical protein [Micromonospora thermarum]|uniref:Uncharacterized protein n=1 Tax=Micromonospora thermarum TaxID=2720024 RepID=A0ABX0ZCI8_9ACTN|nr:hypothetical protein [Micromonospora thermarum]NJP34944.1 hypothetical protein [Micromonospora thermarum]